MTAAHEATGKGARAAGSAFARPDGTFSFVIHRRHFLVSPRLRLLRFARSQAVVYKELQVHGEVLLQRDVTALIVHSRHKSDTDLMQEVEEFRKRCNVEVILGEEKTAT